MYPIFLRVEGKKCLVIGAGKIAKRRVKTLLDENANVTVIAPESKPTVWNEKPITYISGFYSPEVIREYELIFAATNDKEQNDIIVRDAKEAGKWVCSVNDGEIETDFVIPAYRKRGNICVAVATEGVVPALSRAICDEIESNLQRYEIVCNCLIALRHRWKAVLEDADVRKKLLNEMVSEQSISICMSEGRGAYLRHAQALEKKYGLSLSYRPAIIMVSFGTSYAETRENTIGAVERIVQKAYPDIPVFRAFTSKIIIQKLKREGIDIVSVPEMLNKLYLMGYTHIYCQPTHIIPGEEYEDMCKDVQGFQDCFQAIITGEPLLMHTEDFLAVIHALAMERKITKSEQKAYVLMGHGTAHFANIVYPAFDYWLKQMGYCNVFVGTIEGFPTFDNIIALLQKGAYQEVELMPMMLVAGDHAQNDMAGDTPISWKSQLEKMGYAVTVRMEGLGENREIQKLYLSHIQKIIS